MVEVRSARAIDNQIENGVATSPAPWRKGRDREEDQLGARTEIHWVREGSGESKLQRCRCRSLLLLHTRPRALIRYIISADEPLARASDTATNRPVPTQQDQESILRLEILPFYRGGVLREGWQDFDRISGSRRVGGEIFYP